MFAVIFCALIIIASSCARVAIDSDTLPNVSTNLVQFEISNSSVLKEHGTEEYKEMESGNQSKIISNIVNIDKVNNEEAMSTINDNSTDICDNVIDSDDNDCKLNNTENRIDNGTALILTPFIEDGCFDEARNASRVDANLFLGIESYTGFFTVNKTYNSNTFFWYFPVKGKPVNETPWIIWLQGGPGASSLTGLFDEIGPFTVDKANILKKNPYSWSNNHSLLFIDNPVGTGYSFTEHRNGYVKDMETYTKHLYSAVEQFLKIFPELRTAPLYVAGESYAGKYVPCLAMELHKHKTSSALEINLQGIIVGNGYVEPSMISSLPRSFYNLGIVQKEQLRLLKPLQDAVVQEIAANRSVEAKEKWSSLIVVLLTISHQSHAYNFLKDELSYGNYANEFLERSDVKRAIHVGDTAFNIVNFTVNIKLAPDFLSSTAPLYESLLENYRVLSYCGQLDQMLPCVTTSESIRAWQWSRSEDFVKATRYPYMYNRKVAGYHKSGGGFTEVVVRGAGHMVPMDTPKEIQALVTTWTHGKPLYKSLLLQTNFVSDYIKKNSVFI